AEPYEHDFAVYIHARKRLSADLGQRLHRITVHLHYAANGVAGWEHAAQTRGRQHVAHLHISVGGQVWKRERSSVSRTNGYGPQTRSINLNGNGVLRVGDENDFGTEWTDMCCLTQQSLVIHHRLSFEQTVPRAPVDEH